MVSANHLILLNINRSKDYDKLEDNHSYIQWLFPNFYGSAFNSSAYKLEEEEAEEFRTNPEVKHLPISELKLSRLLRD